MDQLDDIRFDLECLLERTKKKVLSLQSKRLSRSDDPMSALQYMLSDAKNENIVFKLKYNIPNEFTKEIFENCTLKDFQSYFKVIRQLSQNKE